MWGAQRETLGLEAGAGGGGGQCSCPAPAACPAPRNESRSAVRIKVLDVLSFVLLINRQFYEVRVGVPREPWGGRGGVTSAGVQGTAGLRSSLRPLLGPLSGRLCFLVDLSLPPSLPGLWLRGQEGTAPAFRKKDLCGDFFFSFCDHARPLDSGWVTGCQGGARPCLPLCCVASLPVYPSLGLGPEPALLSRTATAPPAGLPSPGEVFRRWVCPFFQHLPHGGLAAAHAAPGTCRPRLPSQPPLSLHLCLLEFTLQSPAQHCLFQEALWAPGSLVLGLPCLILRSCSALYLLL